MVVQKIKDQRMNNGIDLVWRDSQDDKDENEATKMSHEDEATKNKSKNRFSRW